MQRYITKIFFLVLLLYSIHGFAQQTMWVGQSYRCDVTSHLMGTSQYDMTWTVNGGYVSLSGSGAYRDATITQYFSGTAIVKCTWKYKLYPTDNWRSDSHTWTISCRANDAYIVPEVLTLDVGDTYELSYAHRYQNEYTSYANPYFSTGSTKISLTPNGKVTALEAGEAYVNLYSKISSTSPVCKITIRDVKPTAVKIPNSKTVYVGESEAIVPELTPSNARTSFTWYCNPSSGVVSISDGMVSGVKEGNATIYCITSNGVRSNDCSVTVYYRTAIGINISKNTLSLPIGQSQTLSWTPVPSNARTSVTWKSDNESVAIVDQSGKITAIKDGTAVVSVTTDNSHTAKCIVTVPPNPTKIELPQRISVYRGDTRTLQPKVTPLDAYQMLTWQSSDNTVATVNSAGEVKGFNPGTATITVTTHNGKTSTCFVDVPEPDFNLYLWQTTGEKMLFPLDEHPMILEKDSNILVKTKTTEIEIAPNDIKKFTVWDERTNDVPTAISLPSNLEMNYRDKVKLDYKLYPTEYDIDTQITWTSSDKNVARVNSRGEVYANLPGECVITATTSNGRTDECQVVVADHDFYLILWFNNGEKTNFRLAEYPKVIHSDDKIIVTTMNSEYSYTATEVRKMTLCDSEDGNDMDGIEDVYEDGHNGRDISLTHGIPGSKLSIYNVSGNLLEQYIVDTEGRLHYSLDSYPSGVYIIKTGIITYKIIKR